MSSLQINRHGRFGVHRAHSTSLTFSALLALSVASALTGAVVALIVQRYVQRHQLIDILPAPAPVRRLQDSSPEHTTTETPVTAPAATTAGSMLAAVSSSLTVSRTAELEQLVAENDDVVAGDGSMSCPADFPIKGNGRSGIYHWPGSHNYQQTQPTLCFRSTEVAERAGFRPATR